MCTNTEEQVNNSSTVKNSDVNITINNQKKLKYGASNLNPSDNPSVDFRIQTHLQFTTSRKIKICLLLNILIMLICISISYILSYKLYMELLQLQNEMITLNARFQNLADKCDEISHMEPEEPKSFVNDPQAQTQTQILEEINIKDGNYELMFTNRRDTVLSRSPRGKRRIKEKNKQRKVKSSGALAAHFKGSVPEVHIKNQGLVGPWYLDSSVSRQYKFPKFHLTEGQCSIEVTEPALYHIYAQVYYITSSAINSYTIFVRSEGSSENNIIAKCSTIGPNNSHSSEISCYTSTVHSLKANDRIFIQQTEKNRTIILRDGHSFFGLVRLNNSVRNKI